MLVELVPEAEYLALEQALLVAEKQHVQAPSKAVLSQKTIEACFAPKVKCAQTPNDESAVSASNSKKRKLPNSFTHQEVQAAPVKSAALYYTGPVTYAYTPFEVDHHCTQLLKTNPTAVGFDIEWRVTYKVGEVRKTALLQLCAKQPHGLYSCLLLHVAHSGLTPALRQLLQDEGIKKVGVGISADAQKLLRDFDVRCGGIVCLAEEAALRLAHRTGGRGLADLVQSVLGHDLDKSPSVRCSNWEKCPLTPEQKTYAATDAYAAIKLYQVLQSMPLLPVQPRTAPVSPAPAPWPAGDEPPQPQLVVPAQAVLLPLQPAKLATYKMFIDEGLSMEAIAAQRTLQLSTVQSYIAEAMVAGHSYPWHRMALPHRLLASLCAHVSAHHKQLQLQHQNEQQQSSQQNEQQIHAAGHHKQLQQQQQAEQQHLLQPTEQAGRTWLQHQSEQQQSLQQTEQQRSAANGQWQALQQSEQQTQGQQLQRGLSSQQRQQQSGQLLYQAQELPRQQELPQQLQHEGQDSSVFVAQPDQECKQSGLAAGAVGAICSRCGLPLKSSSLHLHNDGSVHCAMADPMCHGNSIAADAQPPKCGATADQEGVAPAGKSCSSAVQLPDWSVVAELVLTSKGTKALKDSMDGCQLSYGRIRLGLAHIYCLLRHALCTCKPTPAEKVV